MSLADEYAVVFGAGEVLLSLDDAVVLADGVIEHHADPLPGGELRRPDKSDGADGILARDLHAVPDLHRRHFLDFILRASTDSFTAERAKQDREKF